MKRDLIKNFLLAGLSIFFISGHAFAGDFKLLHPKRLEFRTGYGYQYTNRTRPTNFQITPILPGAIFPLSDSMGPSWFRGHFDWSPELFLGLFTHPYDRPIIGVTPLQFDYALEPLGAFSPYFLIGGGFLESNINRRETGSDWNFNLQGGIGTRLRMSEKTSLILEYRHIHISNAGLHEDNAGLNTHTFLVGFSIQQ